MADEHQIVMTKKKQLEGYEELKNKIQKEINFYLKDEFVERSEAEKYGNYKKIFSNLIDKKAANPAKSEEQLKEAEFMGSDKYLQDVGETVNELLYPEHKKTKNLKSDDKFFITADRRKALHSAIVGFENSKTNSSAHTFYSSISACKSNPFKEKELKELTEILDSKNPDRKKILEIMKNILSKTSSDKKYN